MTSVLQRPGAGQVVTYAPDGTQPRYLGAIGHVTALTYDFACPGGPNQLTCTLQAPATLRTDALNPGRIVRVIRGTSYVWDGKLDEPAPGPDGWNITAHGSGTFGDDFDAVYTGPWPGGLPDLAVNMAISRGLRWVNPGIGSPSGLWLGSEQDSGSLTITDLLNLCCSMGGYTWYVNCRPVQNNLSVFKLPSTVNRLLIASTPVPRTLGGYVNTVWLRYTVTDDGTNPATYGIVEVINQASVNIHGPMETYFDLSSAGVMQQAAVTAVGTAVLQRYQAASYAGPFTVAPGQLLNAGGQPVDLGSEQAGTVVRLLLTDFAYGGEVSPLPVQFLVGGYSYDDDSQTAQITPFNYLANSFSDLLSQAATAITPIATGS